MSGLFWIGVLVGLLAAYPLAVTALVVAHGVSHIARDTYHKAYGASIVGWFPRCARCGCHVPIWRAQVRSADIPKYRRVWYCPVYCRAHVEWPDRVAERRAARQARRRDCLKGATS